MNGAEIEEGASLHIALPRAAALSEVMHSPFAGAVDLGEVERVRARMSDELCSLAKRIEPGSKIRIDEFRLQLSLEAPQRLSRLEFGFSPSPAACRRAIGAAGLSRSLKDSSVAPAQAVASVLEEATTQPAKDSWWGDWYRRLAPGARSVVRAEAVTWATQLHSALEWERFEPAARIGGGYRWSCPSAGQMTLHAKVDVHAWVRERPVFLLVRTGVPGPHWYAGSALSALAAALVRGPRFVPARVVALWPSSGQVRILEVRTGVLDRAQKLAIHAASTLVSTSQRARAGTLMGRL